VLNAVGLLALCCIPLALIGVIGYTRSTITPNDQFFTLQIDEIPQLDTTSYRLIVDGHVANPLNLTYNEILALPNISLIATLQCVEGISATAEWKGVKLVNLLDLAQSDSAVFDVIFYAADGYSSSLSIEQARIDNVLLAYEMNDEPLPPEHGFPLRVVAPSHYGYKWVKWVTQIEVVDYDYLGYWETRGWSDDARVSPISHWSLHAILFSVTYLLGAFALITGLKFSRRTDAFTDLPDFISSKVHRGLSIAYVVSVFGVFIYWASLTILLRSALFYTVHGIVALMVIILHLLGWIITRKQGMANVRTRKRHFDFHLYGFILFTLTIVLGFLLTLGWSFLYIY
jgi:hypothetical protein